MSFLPEPDRCLWVKWPSLSDRIAWSRWLSFRMVTLRQVWNSFPGIQFLLRSQTREGFSCKQVTAYPTDEEGLIWCHYSALTGELPPGRRAAIRIHLARTLWHWHCSTLNVVVLLVHSLGQMLFLQSLISFVQFRSIQGLPLLLCCL